MSGTERSAAHCRTRSRITTEFFAKKRASAMSKRQDWFIIAAILLGASSSRARAEEFADLARRIPADANALVLIDVEKTVAAPLARKQGWAAKLESAFVERPIFLPPEAKKLAMGAALDPENGFNGNWELAVMELAEP